MNEEWKRVEKNSHIVTQLISEMKLLLLQILAQLNSNTVEEMAPTNLSQAWAKVQGMLYRLCNTHIITNTVERFVFEDRILVAVNCCHWRYPNTIQFFIFKLICSEYFLLVDSVFVS